MRVPAFFLTIAALAFAACGGDSDGGAFNVTLYPGLESYQGFSSLSGVVTFSQQVPAGTKAILVVSRDRPTATGVGDLSAMGTSSAATTNLSYRVQTLADGKYYVFVGVFLRGQATLGSGDLGGYYDGATVVPISKPGEAMQASTSGSGDFGIGPLP